jgi:uncharacterized phage protein (TIGR01671 family)
MREYKFRGKRLDNGEWVYGYYYTQIITHAGNRKSRDHFIRTEQNIRYEVDPDTVGQYTGLKDKNGKEICEDDLVAVADYTNWEGLYKVAWDKDGSTYVIEDAYGDREKLCEFEEYLVKGNIHDNPEILEVSRE